MSKEISTAKCNRCDCADMRELDWQSDGVWLCTECLDEIEIEQAACKAPKYACTQCDAPLDGMGFCSDECRHEYNHDLRVDHAIDRQIEAW